jgi:hypothetical protein
VVEANRPGTLLKGSRPRWILDAVHVDDGQRVVDLHAAGAILFKKDKMNLEYFLPVTMEFFAPKEDGLAYDVMAQARTGGVKVYYPLSVVYMDGI